MIHEFGISQGEAFKLTVPFTASDTNEPITLDQVEGIATSAGAVPVRAVVTPAGTTSSTVLTFAPGSLDAASRWMISIRAVHSGVRRTLQVANLTVNDNPFAEPVSESDPPQMIAIAVSADEDNALTLGSDGGAFLSLSTNFQTEDVADFDPGDLAAIFTSA